MFPITLKRSAVGTDAILIYRLEKSVSKGFFVLMKVFHSAEPVNVSRDVENDAS